MKPEEEKSLEKILGRPLKDSDRRLQDLRDSGYKGWVDKEGYPTKGPGKW